MSSIGQGSVSIDDSTLIAEKATNLANDVLGNVSDINSDNKLTPGEKLRLKQEYERDKNFYNLDVTQLQSMGLPTTELDSAIGELTNFITPYFKDMNKTETVDRDQLNHVFSVFAIADKNAEQAFAKVIDEVADDAKKAGEDAKTSADKIADDVVKAKDEMNEAVGKAQDSVNQLGDKVEASNKTITEVSDAVTLVKSDAANALNKAQSGINQLNEAKVKLDSDIASAQKEATEAQNNIKVVDSKVANLSTSTKSQFDTLNSGYQLTLQKIDDISIGGRNYLLSSNQVVDKDTKVLLSVPRSYFSKKKIVVSVDIEVTNLKTVAASGFTRVGFEYTWNGTDKKSYYPSVWQEFKQADVGKSFKLRAVKQYDFSNISFIDDNTNGGLYVQGISADSIMVGNPKIEIGTNSTDWSPAPEDMASQTQITTLNDLINQKVSSSQYQSDKTQTDKLISQKVSSDKYQSDQVQLNNVINSKVSSDKYNTDKTQTDQLIASKVASDKYVSDQTQLNNLINQKVSSSQYQSDKTQTDQLIASKVSSSQYTADKVQTDKLISQKVSQTDFNNLKIGGANLVPNSGYMTSTKGWTTTGTLITTKHAFYHNGQDPIFRLSNAKGSATVGTVANNAVRFPVKRNTKYTMSVITFATSNTVDIDLYFLGRTYGSTNDFDKSVITVAKRKVSFNEAEYVTATFNTGDSDEGYFRIDNNGTTDGKQSDVYFTEVKVEEGTKATPWSPATTDLATATEFDQISDALKLTAKQTDMTKALNSITTLTETANGLQTQVNSKAGQSQVTQLADQYQAVVGSMTGSSLVPNSGYPIDTKHWTIGGEAKSVFRVTKHAFYHNGTDNTFNLINQGTKANLECYASSERFPVKPNTQYSLSFKGFASENVPNMDVYFLGRKYNSTSSTGFDKAILIVNQKVLSPSNVETVQFTFNTGDCEEGYLRFDNNGSTDGKDSGLYFTEIQVNVGSVPMPWSAPTLSQSDITASINNIHMGVKNSDGTTSTFNMNGNTVLMEANKIILNGNTSIQNGTIGTAKIADAAISDAKISNLNANKITAGTINADKVNIVNLTGNSLKAKSITADKLETNSILVGLNSGLTGMKLQPDSIAMTQAGQLTMALTSQGAIFSDTGDLVGQIGANHLQDYPAVKGLNFSLSAKGGQYMSWNAQDEGDTTGEFRPKMAWYRDSAAKALKGIAGFTFFDPVHAGKNLDVEQWGTFGTNQGTGIKVGYRAIENLGTGADIYFNAGGTTGASTLHAKKFATSSLLSRKKDISLLDEQDAMKTIMNTDIYRYHYNEETDSQPYSYSVVIDDKNDVPEYKTPEEFIVADRTGRDDGNTIGFLVQALKNANRRIEKLEGKLNE